MQPLISIIMPVYNTGDILKDTVKSIRCQTFKNYELIMIDDGSNRETSRLCDQFSDLDNRIKVVHKTNGGACAARNLGIDKAKGEYITFCDHDDVYDASILEEEVRLINTSTGFDMAIVGALHISEDGRKRKYGKDIEIYDRDTLEEYTAKVLKAGMLGTVWNILYKRELIGKTRFDEKQRNGHEDIIFNIEIYKKANSLIASKEIFYYHYIRKAMSTSATYHKETVEALKIANNKVYEICVAVFEKICISDYIDLQGEYIRTYSTYLVHLGYTYSELKRKLNELNYIHIKFGKRDLIMHRNKDALCFFCLQNNEVLFLYFCIVLNNWFKRKK